MDFPRDALIPRDQRRLRHRGQSHSTLLTALTLIWHRASAIEVKMSGEVKPRAKRGTTRDWLINVKIAREGLSRDFPITDSSLRTT